MIKGNSVGKHGPHIFDSRNVPAANLTDWLIECGSTSEHAKQRRNNIKFERVGVRVRKRVGGGGIGCGLGLGLGSGLGLGLGLGRGYNLCIVVTLSVFHGEMSFEILLWL